MGAPRGAVRGAVGRDAAGGWGEGGGGQSIYSHSLFTLKAICRPAPRKLLNQQYTDTAARWFLHRSQHPVRARQNAEQLTFFFEMDEFV